MVSFASALDGFEVGIEPPPPRESGIGSRWLYHSRPSKTVGYATFA